MTIITLTATNTATIAIIIITIRTIIIVVSIDDPRFPRLVHAASFLKRANATRV